MVRYRVDTPRSTSVKSTTRSLPVHGQFDGGVASAIPSQWETEWQINPHLFEQIFDLLPTLSIDLFVTCCNVQLPLYLSPFSDMSA